MKYLVTIEFLEAAIPSISQQGVVEHLERVLIPTQDAMVKLEAEKKILAGGYPIGQRKRVFIIEAASNEELGQLLRSLPGWWMTRVDVTPLESFEHQAAQTRQHVERVKAAMQGKR